MDNDIWKIYYDRYNTIFDIGLPYEIKIVQQQTNQTNHVQNDNYFLCECGHVLINCSLNRHKKSHKHKNGIAKKAFKPTIFTVHDLFN
jgi:hypothetical protein